MSPMQARILELLPATPKELARGLYGRTEKADLSAIHAHIHYLRNHVDVRSVKREPDFYDDDRSRILYVISN